MAPSIKVTDDKVYQRRRMTMAALREQDGYDDALGKLMAEADGLYAQVGSVQQQLQTLADEGKATPAKVATLVAQEESLEARKRALVREQLDLRLHLIATRLEGVTYDELVELVDIGGGQITALEEELSSPPTSPGPGGSPS